MGKVENQQYDMIVDLNLTISIIILNVKVQDNQLKGREEDPLMCCFQDIQTKVS